MTEGFVLVVGAGLSGIAAAIELSRAGIRVLIADQALQPGGAVHRQPLPDAEKHIDLRGHRHRWGRLMKELRAQGDRIEIRSGSRFAGIDRNGVVLLTGRQNRCIRPRALVLATGATECVRPRPGWTLPDVISVGAIQMQAKTLGMAPAGKILLAGSGPLLLATAAQLVDCGNPPMAIVEAGRPFRHIPTALRLPPHYLAEGGLHLAKVLAARVPYAPGAQLVRIEETAGGLLAHVSSGSRVTTFGVDLIGLHDGIRPNQCNSTECSVPVVKVGDCREALGAVAAFADGRAGGAALAAKLNGTARSPKMDRAIKRERKAQRLISRIYGHDSTKWLMDLPDETVICRCENRTLGDLRSLGDAPTDRDLRLRGRFAMGRCQGRFCGEWVRRLTKSKQPFAPLGENRLPIRPISIRDILDVEDQIELG